ncbi:MAG: HDOD domain-containing protein [Leptospira sp.]|nr:HDOD domain-containing protein [Leptospira sp.]
MPYTELLKFQDDFVSGKPISKEYVHFSESDCPGLDVWIGRIVRSISLEFLHEILFTILSELLVNGCKANGKRVFFLEQNLDIQNEKDYTKGIPLFKEEFGHFRKRVFQSLEKTSYKVWLTAINFADHIQFSVRNNAKILMEEKHRIDTRVESSLKFKNINDAYRESVDNEESSGLGIVLIHILLRNSGVKNRFFELITSENDTEVVIRIPKRIISQETQRDIRELICREVDSLPPLSALIQKLISICTKPNVEWSEISKEVEKDPATTAEVLKIANSPLFGSHSKTISILDALKRIGLKNLESIFLALGSKKILNSKYPKQLAVWTHSYKTSLVARFLLDERKDLHKYMEVSVVSALLHDLGRMVLLSLDLSLINQIRVLQSENKHEISEWVEEYSLGISHSEIGFMIAKKWNFPDAILDAIQFHHKPWQCRTSNTIICEIIYLSDILANMGKGKGNYFTIEPEILDKFSIKSENEFRDTQDRFRSMIQTKINESEGLFLD